MQTRTEFEIPSAAGPSRRFEVDKFVQWTVWVQGKFLPFVGTWHMELSPDGEKWFPSFTGLHQGSTEAYETNAVDAAYARIVIDTYTSGDPFGYLIGTEQSPTYL